MALFIFNCIGVYVMHYKKCELCEYKGYSQEVCRLHLKKMKCNHDNIYYDSGKAKQIGKKACYGAGIGFVATATGLAAAPIIGMKTIIGHLVALKISAGGSAIGAGVNVIRKDRDKEDDRTIKPKTRHRIIPFC